MATSLTTTIKATLGWTFTDAQAWANSANASSFTYSKSLTNGTAADKADNIYLAQTTLAASGTVNLDLAGSVTDIYGNTITFARVKALYFELTTTTSASAMTLGAHGSAAALAGSGNLFGDTSDKVRIHNGGVFLVASPGATAYPVTATTADILLMTNEDGSNIATYKLAIVGASA